MRRSYGDTVIATVSYADIFAYPLTLDEIRHWVVGTTHRGKPDAGTLHSLTIVHDRGQTYAVLKGREHLVALRNARRRTAKKKWLIARRVALLFRIIPSVELIGITGGLSMDNVTASDDIDVFIIAREGTLWATRLWVTVLADIIGIRRHPHDRTVADKVCLNMFMDDGSLAVPTRDRDLFAAHEVLQMKPVWERNGAYGMFLRANRWAAAFLPNAWKEKVNVLRISYYEKSRQETRSFMRTACTALLRLSEPVVRNIQLRYMQKSRTKEVVSDMLIRFHPLDARIRVKKELDRRLRKYNMPLDKFFYDR